MDNISDEVVEAAKKAFNSFPDIRIETLNDAWRLAITAAILADRSSDARVREERDACVKICRDQEDEVDENNGPMWHDGVAYASQMIAMNISSRSTSSNGAYKPGKAEMD